MEYDDINPAVDLPKFIFIALIKKETATPTDYIQPEPVDVPDKPTTTTSIADVLQDDEDDEDDVEMKDAYDP